MAWLTALLPVKDAVAAYAALGREADTAQATGDPRTRGQVMADTLVDSVLDSAATRDQAATRWHQPHPEPAPDPTEESTDPRTPARAARRGVGIDLGLVMTDLALFGTNEQPAHLQGYGPIPAELARELIADALTRAEKTWVRRLYTHPTTGELVSMDSCGRRFRNSLARFIRLRDRTCRTPWCDAPIRHTDHPHDWADDGPTSACNGQGLCEACNYAKQAPGWHADPRPGPGATGGHQVETTTPTGHRHRTRPPTLATIREVPIHIDFALTA